MDALKEFNALVVSEQLVTEILEHIYLDDPWKINPNLDRKILAATANNIVSEFTGSEIVD